MQPQDFEIIEHKFLVPDVYSLKVKPSQGSLFTYVAGQFCQLRNLQYKQPHEPHSFSIASSPTTKDHLEFCYKVYGGWTRTLSAKKVGESINVVGPLGKFTWSDDTKHAVFLAGGIGIVPMLSMMRFNVATKVQTPVTLLYGNRTEHDIAYRDEIAYLISKLPSSKVVNVLSDIKEDDTSWGGYRGFITKKILEKEVDFTDEPVFFLCGPPVFVQLMKDLLKEFQVPVERVKQELFTTPTKQAGNV